MSNPPHKPFAPRPTPPTVPEISADLGTLTLEQPAAEQDRSADTAMWAIVLAGGIGSRFWPLSTPERPKQLLRLIGDRPLITETITRLSPLVPPDRVLVLTSRDIAPAIHAAIPEVPKQNMLVEPRPLGTAAAVAWGAQEVARRAGPETVFCCVHADLAVGFPELFRQALLHAARVAAAGPALVAIGVPATRPETAFGYIRTGVPVHDHLPDEGQGAHRVVAFIEKPGPTMAETLVRDGALWNTGIFVWRASVVLDALQKHTHEVAIGLTTLKARNYERYAELVKSISIERGLLERSRDVIAVFGDFGWDDVGTWASLRRSRELDDDGNGAIGPVHFVESTGNVVHSESGTVVVYGLSSMLVVSLPGLTFVTTLDRASELRPLLDALPADVRVRTVGPG
jgi:mannose-1-phosphate guanylyltransferase